MDGLQVGRMVHYIATADDADKINRRRTDGGSVYKRTQDGTWPQGAQAHIGNGVSAGQHLAAVIVCVWSSGGVVNLKVLLDGNDDFWANSIPYHPEMANEPRTWHWIEKE